MNDLLIRALKFKYSTVQVNKILKESISLLFTRLNIPSRAICPVKVDVCVAIMAASPRIIT